MLASRCYGAEMHGTIVGAANPQAAAESDLVALTIPHENAVAYVRSLRSAIGPNKIVISPVVPMRRMEGWLRYRPYPPSLLTPSGTWYSSAAEVFARELSSNKVVAALHTLPAAKLADPTQTLDYDVLLCGDDPQALATVSGLVKEIPRLRPLHAGPLAAASLVEALTPLLLNVAALNKIKDPSIRII